MRKQESKLYEDLRKALPNVHFQRIETNVGLGIPDVTKKEAAKHAGYADKICEKTGSLLTNPDKYPHVVAYIEKLRDSAAKAYKDHYRHLRRLDDLSKKAEDKGQLAAAINAEFRLGQSVGLYVDKKEIKVQDLSAMSKEELIKQINELRDEIPNSKVLEIEAEEGNDELEDWKRFLERIS